MATPLVPMINGVRYSWASIELKIKGKIVTGIQEISYKNTIEREKVRGQGRAAIGIAEGDLDCEASMGLLLEDYQALLDELAPDKVGAFDVPFTAVVSYELPSGKVITDTLIDCRIKEGDKSHSRGAEALKVTCPLDVMDILEDGHRVTRGAN